MNAYRGTNIEQDGRFGNKEKQLLKTMRFDKALDTKVDIKKVQIDVVKPWITKKLTAMLGIEDDVVAEFVFAQLEEKDLNPKRLQINITGFLNARRAREFVSELWTLLVEAQESPDGIPESLITKKMEELKAASNRREMPMARATESDWKHRYQTITGGRYGREAPNYASEPGAGDDVNREPESPSNRRWKREPTPDIPIPRRKRGDAENSDRPELRRRNRRPLFPKKSRKHHDSDSSPDAKRSKKEKKQKKEKKKKRDHDEEDD
ncbi:Serine arginine repetitive matrix protein [Aphelenchoides fujianensis]|nr:Serine arginine repetitive matrix protein [Aphelenchoides fujianensis]